MAEGGADVVVVGGGPSGTAAAILLRRRGFERTSYRFAKALGERD